MPAPDETTPSPEPVPAELRELGEEVHSDFLRNVFEEGKRLGLGTQESLAESIAELMRLQDLKAQREREAGE